MNGQNADMLALARQLERHSQLTRLGFDTVELLNKAAAVILCAASERAAEPVTDVPAQGWPNGCDRTVPAALRFLAEKPRPVGGQSQFNSEHLHQLANEIEQAARAVPAEGRPASNDLREAVENLFAGGFIEAGTRANDQWSCELAARVERLRNALATCRSPAEKVVPDASRTIAGVSQRFDPLPSQPATSPTIDNVPSCGQENDYQRARPSQPGTEKKDSGQ